LINANCTSPLLTVNRDKMPLEFEAVINII